MRGIEPERCAFYCVEVTYTDYKTKYPIASGCSQTMASSSLSELSQVEAGFERNVRFFMINRPNGDRRRSARYGEQPSGELFEVVPLVPKLGIPLSHLCRWILRSEHLQMRFDRPP